MTLDQHIEAALMRAKHCISRRKDSRAHFREATLTAGLKLARENQRKGKHYSQAQLSILRGPSRDHRKTPSHQTHVHA